MNTNKFKEVLEIQEDAIRPGWKVMLVDDLLATGESMNAAISLIQKAGGDVAEAFALVELAYLSPRKVLPPLTPLATLITIDHETL